MPSLPLRTIPAGGIETVEITAKQPLAVLSINNLGANIMRYCQTQSTDYGDVIWPGGFKAYHVVDGDKIPNVFYIYGTATDTFSVHYEVK